MNQPISNEQFVQAMRDAVAERGEDFVYPLGEPGWSESGSGPGCLYARKDTGEPACLIGLALSKCGVTNETLLEMNSAGSAEGVLVALTADGKASLSGEVIMAANSAQARQDDLKPWGNVLRVFIQDLEALGVRDV